MKRPRCTPRRHLGRGVVGNGDRHTRLNVSATKPPDQLRQLDRADQHLSQSHPPSLMDQLHTRNLELLKDI
jgi:hypothetical protein